MSSAKPIACALLVVGAAAAMLGFRRIAAQEAGTAPSPLVSFFVTSAGNGAAGGNLGGLAGADLRCSQLATAAELPGTSWRAYLSTQAVDARDRIGAGPWYNWNGTAIASDVDALHANGIAAAAMLDENGDAVPSNRHDILTGSSSSGELHSLGANCADFQTSSASYYVAVGHSDGGGVGQDVVVSWNSAHLTDCSEAGFLAAGGDGRLYCFLATPVATPTPTGTSTPTTSPTATRTVTATPSPSATRTLTATPSPSATRTVTATPTVSATPTSTATSTSSATATVTPTRTVTATPGAGAIADADGDGEVQPLTDGLLILRWLFGFGDAALVAGAVDLQDCTRCTAAPIQSHLASVASQLDADGDGEQQPLTDGLLVLRWLFGFSGATLVAGAVDEQSCTRCTAPEVESHLATLD